MADSFFRLFIHFRLRVIGDAEACRLNHRQVVGAVTDSHGLRRWDLILFRQLAQRIGFIFRIDDIAELWADSPARSLPGTLWRLYLLQISIRDDAATTALLYERGRVELQTADAVIAGAPAPASPQAMA